VFNRMTGPDNKAAEAPKPAAMTVGTGGSPFGAGPSQPQPQVSAIPASGSVIGSDLTIVGQKITIVSQGRLVIDGDVRGDINGREVQVGKNGRVTGTIVADTVDVLGSVTGALKGQHIMLQSSARVDGDILHQSLAIAEGACFDGRVRRPQDAGEITPVLDVAKLAPTG
jgi:cytoskeletal protein CcmA (bactofilin family)